MIVKIISQSFNPTTGKPKNNPREETIDTSTNQLFVKCRTLVEVVECYYHFWNKFPTYHTELVLVQSISVVKK